MPLSDHEQRILDEIEKRLQEEDPRLADAVGRTSLHTHMARLVRLAVLGFVVGFVMLMLFALSVWVAIAGFAVMLASALLIYQQFRTMGQDQVREYSAGRFSLTGLLARLSERFRGGHQGRT
jgi:protein-S-isoprenylcysteine O-methyltransferase Ste14